MQHRIGYVAVRGRGRRRELAQSVRPFRGGRDSWTRARRLAQVPTTLNAHVLESKAQLNAAPFSSRRCSCRRNRPLPKPAGQCFATNKGRLRRPLGTCPLSAQTRLGIVETAFLMTEKIGVLFVLTQDHFGADTAVHSDIIRYLDRDNYAVHVACSAGDGRTVPTTLTRIRAIPDIRLKVVHFAPGFRHRSAATMLRSLPALAYFPKEFLTLRQYIVRERIRIVHSTERPRDAVYGVTLAKLSGAKSTVHVHVKWADGYTRAAKWGVRNADAVFAISQFVGDSVAKFRRDPRTIYTVLNSIDATRWDPNIDGTEIRREFGIPTDALVLTSVSRLFPEKGQTQLVRAFAKVHAELPNTKLLIVGADELWLHGRSYTEELKQLARELGVAEHVIFPGQRADIPKIMAASDSVYDAQPGRAVRPGVPRGDGHEKTRRRLGRWRNTRSRRAWSLGSSFYGRRFDDVRRQHSHVVARPRAPPAHGRVRSNPSSPALQRAAYGSRRGRCIPAHPEQLSALEAELVQQ